MQIPLYILVFLLLTLGVATAATPEAQKELPAITTIWPLLDYRQSNDLKSTKLSLLGPFFSFDSSIEGTVTAFRPMYHSTKDPVKSMDFTYYLYPFASSETTPDVSRFQIFEIFQINKFRKEEPEREKNSMLFPFYISGESKKYGPYTSIFPIYGDIYERFWRDEYHYILFPLYGRTVKNGTTNYNVLWPFFSIRGGENESGFRFWPIYGQASKTGVYEEMFFLWPIVSKEKHFMNSDEIEERAKFSLRRKTATPTEADNVSERLSIFPLYASYDAPNATSRTWLWPFFGYSEDRKKKEIEHDYFWPFWMTVEGEKRNVTRFLPFYSSEKTDDSTRNWYLWPLYRNDTMQSPHYRQERDRLLFFLFSNRLESWAVDGKSRQRTALWPLFLLKRDTEGKRTLSIPAPVEPILDREGIENLWAPFWQLYRQSWDDNGGATLSIFWNLYWYERDTDSTGWELFPLLRERKTTNIYEFQLLKGIIEYNEHDNKRSLSLFWLPFGFEWMSEKGSDKK